jgi:VWFA-related protein
MPRVVSKSKVLAGLSLASLPFLFLLSAPAPTGSVLAGATATSVTEVTVELTAHDRKGNPVPDLQPSDVEITDGGVPVSLTSLRFSGQTQETILFVFDEVVPGVAKTDRDLAEEVLAGVAGHGYLFSVLKVEKRLHLVQTPTTDIEAVKAAIEAVTMAKRPDYIKVTEAAEKQMTEDLDSAAGTRQATAKILLAMLQDSQKTAESDAQSTPSVAALLALSRGQQDVPGRKAILYFSQGLDWKKSSPETLRDIMQAANRERASIYSFDAEMGDIQAAQALNAGAAMGNQQAAGIIPTGPAVPARGPVPESMVGQGMGVSEQSNEYAGRLETSDNTGNPHSLTAVCANTGGTHVFAMTEGHKGASEIAMDLNAYYLASWISPGSGDETKLRMLRVKSLRKGVLVASRSGYYPMRSGNVARVSAFEGRLIEALAAAKLPADLPLSAALLRFGNTPDSQVNSVVVQVPLDQVEMKDDRGSVAVLAQLKDQSGAVVQKFSADVAPRRTVGEQAQAAQDIVTFRRQFSAPPGEYVLESAAMDANGGKIGARRSNVVIPAMANGLALGDVLVVWRIDAGGPADATDPLRCAEGIVVPNLSGHVSKAAGPKINLFFDLHMDPASTETPTLSAELRRHDDLIGTMPLKMPVDPKRKTFPYLTTLGANDLKPGKYEMTIILRQGGQKVSRSVWFTLD